MDSFERMLTVKEQLELHGFTTESMKFENVPDYFFRGRAFKEGKYEYVPVDGCSYELLYGYHIIFQAICKKHILPEDRLINIQIIEYNASCGNLIDSELIDKRMGKRSIANKVRRLAEVYDSL